MSPDNDDLGICAVCGSTAADRGRRTPLENFVADAGLLVGQAMAASPAPAETMEAHADGRVTARLIFDERRAVVAVGIEHIDGGTVPLGTYDLSTGELIPAGPDGSPDGDAGRW